METKMIRTAIAAICVAAALPSLAADRTITSDYTLSADETVDGTLTVAPGVTVDLNGHNLTVSALAPTIATATSSSSARVTQVASSRSP